MSLWTNHVTVDASAAASHTLDPSNPTAIGTVVDGAAFTPTAGRLLVCVVGGPVTSSTPTGWTLPSGGSAVSTDGLYVFTKTAAGSDTLATSHNSGSYRVIFDVYEFPSTASFGTSASFPAAASGSTKTLSGLTGSNLVMSPVCAPGTAGSFSFSGATKHLDVLASDSQSRLANSSTYSSASSVGVAATSASHEQLVFSIAGLSPQDATVVVPVATATADALTPTVTATVDATVDATVAVPTATATATALAPALALGVGTDTANVFNGRRRGGSATVDLLVPTEPAPAGTTRGYKVDKAVPLPMPTLVNGRPT